MTLVEQFRAWLARPQIVHRLPGRLRLRVPAIRQIDPAQHEWAGLWSDLLGGIAGIQSVEVTLATGSVLIRYDPGVLEEAELLDFLRAVNRLVLAQWDRLAALPQAELPGAVRELAGSLRHRLAPGGGAGRAADV